MSRIQAQQDAQLIRAALPLLALTLIGRNESYGYQLVERLADYGLQVTTGLVYPLLSRLERDGLVSSRMVASTSGPPRKYFSPTATGKAAKASAEAQWHLVSAVVEQTIAKEHSPND